MFNRKNRDDEIMAAIEKLFYCLNETRVELLNAVEKVKATLPVAPAPLMPGANPFSCQCLPCLSGNPAGCWVKREDDHACEQCQPGAPVVDDLPFVTVSVSSDLALMVTDHAKGTTTVYPVNFNVFSRSDRDDHDRLTTVVQAEASVLFTRAHVASLGLYMCDTRAHAETTVVGLEGTQRLEDFESDVKKAAAWRLADRVIEYAVERRAA